MNNLKKDLHDKLTNGILTPLLQILLAFFLSLLMPVFEILSGRPGLLIYAVVLIAGSTVLLDQSLNEKFTETIKGRCGITGGMVGWMVIETSIKIDLAKVSSETGIIVYMLVFLIVFIFWRRVFPLGAKFFFTVFMACWSGHIFLEVIRFLSIGNPYAILILQIIAFTAVGIAITSLLWILFRSTTPVQRLWAAVVFGLSLTTIAYALRVFLPPFYL